MNKPILMLSLKCIGSGVKKINNKIRIGKLTFLLFSIKVFLNNGIKFARWLSQGR